MPATVPMRAGAGVLSLGVAEGSTSAPLAMRCDRRALRFAAKRPGPFVRRPFGITVRIHFLFPLIILGLILRVTTKEYLPGTWIDMSMILGLLFIVTGLSGVAGVIDISGLRDRTQRLQGDHVAKADDRVERGAQFMAHRREKRCFCAVGAARVALCTSRRTPLVVSR